ncbi:class I SAM-dependent methyltransferase [Streptomyces cinerochromogenes]|uniref:class I SAM-dependent methyltransferase n=1 Tax=Streptomyces cinerochromogenes TaxID=66422 RepID=UPI0019A9F1EC|nr:class I SAM-dependent methyltransferase [Streptomyces cinerochromogenes]GGS51492.1 SAM-dependent methyltransferase [Streptomyces cinerochromogenes]
MTPTPAARLLDALHRFNAAHPWDHNARYHPWLLRQLPRRFGTALDVGCGSGDLVRLLARRAREVHGVDADAEILDRARQSTPAPASAAVTYTVADASRALPDGPYDVITCVAVLHHLPLAETLTRLRDRLAPGGTLVVVGCARASGALDHVLGLSAVALNPVVGWVKNRGRPAPRPVSMTARTREPRETRAEISRTARRILPGARLRRRLFWRYTLVWRAPAP